MVQLKCGYGYITERMQGTLVSQLQKANLALQTSKLINFNYNKYKFPSCKNVHV